MGPQRTRVKVIGPIGGAIAGAVGVGLFVVFRNSVPDPSDLMGQNFVLRDDIPWVSTLLDMVVRGGVFMGLIVLAARTLPGLLPKDRRREIDALSQAQQVSWTRSAKIVGYAAGIPLCACFTLGFESSVGVAAYGLAGIAIVLLAGRLVIRTRHAITEEVSGGPRPDPLAADVESEPDAADPHDGWEPVRVGVERLPGRCYRIDDLPQPTPEFLREYESSTHRGADRDGVYHRASLVLFAALVGVVGIEWAMGRFVSMVGAGVVGAAVLLLMLVNFPWLHRIQRLQRIAEGSVRALDGLAKVTSGAAIPHLDRRMIVRSVEPEPSRLGRFAPPLVSAWLAGMVLASGAGPATSQNALWSWIGTLFVIAAVVLTAGWALRARRRLEAERPVLGGVNLLLLRVFGSRNYDTFVRLIDPWSRIGPRRFLDGPDTVGGRVEHVFHYLTGRIDRAIIQDEQELAASLHDLESDDVPNRQLVFPSRSIQCTNATWKEAIDAMLEDSDCVVMDLSGFCEERRGCEYEIGLLVTRVDPSRVVFLIDRDTDIALLRQLLRKHWRRRRMPSGASTTLERLTFVHMDAEGGPELEPVAVSAAQMTSLVWNVAQAADREEVDGHDAGPDVRRWTRTSIPRPVRTLSRAALVGATGLAAAVLLFVMVSGVG